MSRTQSRNAAILLSVIVLMALLYCYCYREKTIETSIVNTAHFGKVSIKKKTKPGVLVFPKMGSLVGMDSQTTYSIESEDKLVSSGAERMLRPLAILQSVRYGFVILAFDYDSGWYAYKGKSFSKIAVSAASLEQSHVEFNLVGTEDAESYYEYIRQWSDRDRWGRKSRMESLE